MLRAASPEQAAHTLGLGLQPLTLVISSQESGRQTEQHASGNSQLMSMVDNYNTETIIYAATYTRDKVNDCAIVGGVRLKGTYGK